MAQLLYNNSYKIGGFETSIDDIIDYIIKNNCVENYIIIVPTKKSSIYFKKKIIRDHFKIYKTPIDAPRIYNLEDFIKLVFSSLQISKDYTIISPAYQLAVFESAINKTDLKYFKRNNSKISDGLLKEIFQMVYGLKEDGIDLKNPVHFKPVNNLLENRKLLDLKNIAEQYEAELGNLLDNAGIINVINNFLDYFKSENNKNALDSVFNEKDIVLSFGFSEFKDPEFQFISKFSDSVIPFAMNIDYSIKNGPIFGNLYNSLNRLVYDLGFKSKDLHNDENDIYTDNPYLADTLRTIFLRRWLFTADNIKPYNSFDEIISIFKCEDKKSEITFVAKKIKELVSQGVNYSEICVCFRQPETYSGYVRDIFTQHKIPSFVSDRYNLSNSNLISSIFSLIDIILNKFQKIDIQKALSSRYIKFPAKNNDEINPTNLLNIANTQRISNFNKKFGSFIWENTLSNLCEKTKNIIKSLDDDSFEYFLKTKELYSFEKAKRDFQILKDSFEFEDKDYTTIELEKIIKINIIEKFKIKDNILSFNKRILDKSLYNNFERLSIKENLEKDARALNAFIDVLDEQINVLNQTRKNGKIRFSEFINQLRVAVSGSKYNVKEKSEIGVLVTATEQIRSIPFKYSFLCGLIDGEFPLAYNPRKVFGLDLPETKSRHEESDRMNYYQFLTNNPDALNDGSKRIFLTYPQNSENEILVHSQFLDALIRKTNLKINNIPDYYKDLITSNYEISKLYNNLNKNDIIENCPENLRKEFKPVENYSKNPNLDINNYVVSQILTEASERSISPSEMDLYALCPYKHFVSKLLKINEITEEEDDVSNKEIGTLLHEILYRFFSLLQSEENNEKSANIESIKDKKPVKLIEEKFEYYKEILISISNKVIEQSFESGINTRELKNSIIGIKNKSNDKYDYDGLVINWLRNEIEFQKSDNLYPSLFEFGFGSKFFSKNIFEVKISNGENKRFIKLKGKIDRIDLLVNNLEVKFRIIDYKTTNSSVVSSSSIAKGKKFQLPLYAKAIESILLDELEMPNKCENLTYLILKPKIDPNSKAPIYKADLKIPVHRRPEINDYDKLIEISINFALENLEKIKEGFFVPTSEEQSCRFCDYKNICRIQENRKYLIQ
jgi:ATP-dependent helicase/DNAse subunit B